MKARCGNFQVLFLLLSLLLLFVFFLFPFGIMCTKGIHSQVLISSLNRPSIDTRLHLHRHSTHISTDTLYNRHSADISINSQLMVDQVSRPTGNWVFHQVLTKYLSRRLSHADQDVNGVLIEGQYRSTLTADVFSIHVALLFHFLKLIHTCTWC